MQNYENFKFIQKKTGIIELFYTFANQYMFLSLLCPGGGTGRRAGLKIQ